MTVRPCASSSASKPSLLLVLCACYQVTARLTSWPYIALQPASFQVTAVITSGYCCCCYTLLHQVLDLGYSRSERVPKSCWSCLTALTRLCLSGAGLQGYRHVPLKELPSLVHLELRDQKLGPKALLGCTGLQVRRLPVATNSDMPSSGVQR
jgi:hypothetical protein